MPPHMDVSGCAFGLDQTETLCEGLACRGLYFILFLASSLIHFQHATRPAHTPLGNLDTRLPFLDSHHCSHQAFSTSYPLFLFFMAVGVSEGWREGRRDGGINVSSIDEVWIRWYPVGREFCHTVHLRYRPVPLKYSHSEKQIQARRGFPRLPSLNR